MLLSAMPEITLAIGCNFSLATTVRITVAFVII
jgi:hypothetical protein